MMHHVAHSPLAGLFAPAGVGARAPCLARWIRSAHGDRLGQHHGHQPPAPAALQLVELRARGALRLGLADAPEALLELRVAEVAAPRDLGVAADAPQLGRLALELLRELAAQVDDAGRGLTQLRVLRHALPDGGDVDRVGVALLAAADPARGEAAQEVPDSSDEWHGLSFTPLP